MDGEVQWEYDRDRARGKWEEIGGIRIGRMGGKVCV